VAGSIEFMMGGADKEKTQTRSNPFYFEYYNPYGGNRASQTDSSDKFKVDADVENNRLLLWANEIELREIENLLVKLGEIPPPGGNRSTQRYLENLDPEDADQLLERVRKMWPGISPNELIIEDAAPPRKPRRPEPTESPDATTPLDESSKKKSPTKINAPKAQAAHPKAREVLLAVADDPTEQKLTEQVSNLLSQEEVEVDETPAVRPNRVQGQNRDGQVENLPPGRTPPPIRIRRGPDGKLILESQDTAALDQLEDLLQEAAPPKRDYKVFYLKYPSTWAYSVELSLKDFFEEDKKKPGSTFDPYFGRMVRDSSQDSSRRLSKRKPLKFISDSDSGTIIVQGATPEQLKVVEELINIYDQPLASDGKQVRKTQVFTLKYSKATVLAEAIKDVYRDLLSATDKALQNNQPGKEGQKPPERNYTFIYGGGGDDDKSKQQETPVKFKGLISVGVDDISNTIIVSAPESLLENISELIDQLDRAARPTNSVQVVKLDGRVSATELQKRLSKIFTKPQPRQQQKPNQPQQPQQPQQQPAENADEPLIVP